MENQKKFFFNKKDKAVKEILDNKKMNLIVGGLEEISEADDSYGRQIYAESTDVRKYRKFPR